jgi:hypothetical protein
VEKENIFLTITQRMENIAKFGGLYKYIINYFQAWRTLHGERSLKIIKIPKLIGKGQLLVKLNFSQYFEWMNFIQ